VYFTAAPLGPGVVPPPAALVDEDVGAIVGEGVGATEGDGEAVPGTPSGGRMSMASSAGARKSLKQYRHLMASSWIISAQ
jgi:hypothetical protein